MKKLFWAMAGAGILYGVLLLCAYSAVRSRRPERYTAEECAEACADVYGKRACK